MRRRPDKAAFQGSIPDRTPSPGAGGESLGSVAVSFIRLPEAIFRPGKAEEAQCIALHKRPTTQHGQKMAPALRVAPVKPPLGVARRLRGITTLRFSLLDWRFYRQQQADEGNVNRPWDAPLRYARGAIKPSRLPAPRSPAHRHAASHGRYRPAPPTPRTESAQPAAA